MTESLRRAIDDKVLKIFDDVATIKANTDTLLKNNEKQWETIKENSKLIAKNSNNLARIAGVGATVAFLLGMAIKFI